MIAVAVEDRLEFLLGFLYCLRHCFLLKCLDWVVAARVFLSLMFLSHLLSLLVAEKVEDVDRAVSARMD